MFDFVRANRLYAVHRQIAASIYDRPSRNQYLIFYNRKLAEVEPNSPGDIGPAPGSAAQAQEAESRQTVIHGIPCMKMDILIGGPNRQLQKAGYTCAAYQLGGLKVYSEHEVTLNNETHQFVTELVEMKEGAVPDPSWFQVPPGFTVRTRQPK